MIHCMEKEKKRLWNLEVWLEWSHSQQLSLHSLFHPGVLHVPSCQKHIAHQCLLLLWSVPVCDKGAIRKTLLHQFNFLFFNENITWQKIMLKLLKMQYLWDKIKFKCLCLYVYVITVYHYLARMYCSVSISPIWSSPVDEGWNTISGHRRRSVPTNSWWYSAMLNTGWGSKLLFTHLNVFSSSIKCFSLWATVS